MAVACRLRTHTMDCAPTWPTEGVAARSQRVGFSARARAIGPGQRHARCRPSPCRRISVGVRRTRSQIPSRRRRRASRPAASSATRCARHRRRRQVDSTPRRRRLPAPSSARPLPGGMTLVTPCRVQIRRGGGAVGSRWKFAQACISLCHCSGTPLTRRPGNDQEPSRYDQFLTNRGIHDDR